MLLHVATSVLAIQHTSPSEATIAEAWDDVDFKYECARPEET